LRLAKGPDAHISSATDHITAMTAFGWSDQVEERKQFLYDRVDPCEVEHILQDGDTIDLGSDLSFRVIHTPGHADGCVTYYSESLDLAITGDAVLGWGVQKGTLPLYYDPWAYEQSLNKIASLQAEALCMGHNVRWSGYQVGSSPVRRGEAAAQTLYDSQQILAELTSQIAHVNPSASLSHKVEMIARVLSDPFEIPFDDQGRMPASSAATIISHLKGTVRR